MEAFNPWHTLAGALAFVLSSYITYCLLSPSVAYSEGVLAARVNIYLGRYDVLGYGLPPPEREEFVQILKTRYGIRFRPIAECLISPDIVAYSNGYNRISFGAAEERFGWDIFEKAWNEAEAKWSQSEKAESRN